MIGLIFRSKLITKLVNGNAKYENVQYYFDLAEKNKIDLLFYSLDRIDFQKLKVRGYLYSHSDKIITKQILDIPKVNLLRVIISRAMYYKKFQQIEKQHKITFINLLPERNKYKVYQFLNNNNDLNPYIPHTLPLSYQTLTQLIKSYNKILIKPNNGAFGEKIFVIERIRNRYIIKYNLKKQQIQKVITARNLNSFFKNHFKYPSFFLIQPWISFKTYQDRTFDIRTSVQKDKNEEWQVTGIVTRVAKMDGIATNIAQGGTAVSFKEVQSILDPEIHEKINQLSIDISKHLEKLYPSIADLGLDIGIDEDNHLWFIEANSTDQRYSYRESKDIDMWFASYKYPLEYAYGQYIKELDSNSQGGDSTI